MQQNTLRRPQNHTPSTYVGTRPPEQATLLLWVYPDGSVNAGTHNGIERVFANMALCKEWLEKRWS